MSTGEQKALHLQCAICIGYHPPPAMRVLRCGHIFCEHGILEHWRTMRHNPRRPPLNCPLCKGVSQHSRDARLDYTMSEKDWLETCKLFLRKIYVDSACYAPLSAQGLVYLDDLSPSASQLGNGTSKAAPPATYSADVLAKAKDLSARLRSIDKSIDTRTVERAADELKGLYTAMPTWTVEDPILDLFGAFHDFMLNSVTRAFKLVGEKDKQVRRKDQEIRELREAKDELEDQARRQEKLVDDSVVAASQAAEKVEELRDEVEGLRNSRKLDKQKIVDLQGSIQTSKTTEARLRKRLAQRDEEKKNLEKELAATRAEAAETQQKNEDLLRQAGYPQPYGDVATEFTEGSSQDLLYPDDVDLDSQLSDGTAPPSSYHTRDSLSSDPPDLPTIYHTPPPPKRPAATRPALNIPPPPRFPEQLSSSWNLPPSATAGLGKRKWPGGSEPRNCRAEPVREGSTAGGAKLPSAGLPFRLDRNGRPMGQLQLGSRTRLNKFN